MSYLTAQSFQLCLKKGDKPIILDAIKAELQTTEDTKYGQINIFRDTHKSIPLMEVYRIVKQGSPEHITWWQAYCLAECLEYYRDSICRHSEYESWPLTPLIDEINAMRSY